MRGSTFIRLLARLTDADVSPSRQSLSDRLSQWLDWTHAIALSTAIDRRASTDIFDAPSFGLAEAEECARVRASLAETIKGDAELAAGQADAAEVEYTVFRQRYLTLQRRMQSATGNLRGRLRDLLAQKTPEMARLAEVDAVMERALSPREHTLLAAVPAVLGEHFERLRKTGQAPVDAPSDENSSTATTSAWLDTFRRDMQSVLLAELDVRFQPVEGLLAALRTR
nr:DUF3348 domain-containing protein [Dyella amyloliquefaciens]